MLKTTTVACGVHLSDQSVEYCNHEHAPWISTKTWQSHQIHIHKLSRYFLLRKKYTFIDFLKIEIVWDLFLELHCSNPSLIFRRFENYLISKY